MLDPAVDALIRQWSDRFRKTPLARTAVVGLRTRADEIWQHAFELLQRESPEYRNAVDDEFTEESKAHCNELLLMIIAVASGQARRSTLDPFDFVRAHAQWRARHHVPLVASLFAYRIAHRTYSEISQDALGQHGTPKDIVRAQRILSQFWIEFFDHVGHVLADAHAAEDALIVAQETRSYVRLMNGLLCGVEPAESELQRLCTLRGIRRGAPLAVAVAKPVLVNTHHVDREVTLRSLARRLEQALSPTVFGRLIDVRDSQVTAIVCSGSDTGSNLVQALRRGGFAKHAANGQSAGVGISLDVSEVARLPEALKEALIAVEFTQHQATSHAAFRYPSARPSRAARRPSCGSIDSSLGAPAALGGRKAIARTDPHDTRICRLQFQCEVHRSETERSHQHGIFPA